MKEKGCFDQLPGVLSARRPTCKDLFSSSETHLQRHSKKFAYL